MRKTYSNPVHYYVEGECEEKLINALKTGKDSFRIPCKVEVFNVIRDRLSIRRLASLTKRTIIVFVYDTDIPNTDILNENINLLEKSGFTTIHHIQSIRCFEDEIVRSTSLENINDCFSTENVEEFKAQFIAHKDIVNKLKKIDFDDQKLWMTSNTEAPFSTYYKKSSQEFIPIRKK